MTKKFLLWTTLFSAIGTLAVQFCALTSLGTEDFGLFSLVYLIAAFALSIQLSAVSEAWIRTTPAANSADWGSYSSVSVFMAVLSGLVALVIALVNPDLNPFAALIFVAVAATVYRAAARFYSLRNEDARGVLWADLVSMVVAAGGAITVFVLFKNDLAALFALWAATALSSALLSRPPRMTSWRELPRWYTERRNAIAPLLGESLFMDLSAIGTPLLMIPFMGIADFGVYRGVSNVAAPVRIILNPLRPRLSHLSQQRIRRLSTTISIGAGSLLMGVLAALALVIISLAHLELGTLSSLTVFAIPTGLFVSANMFGHTYYMLARQHSPAKVIVTARIVQTLVGVIFPLVGVVAWGLPGAIWGYAIATVISACFWAYSVIGKK